MSLTAQLAMVFVQALSQRAQRREGESRQLRVLEYLAAQHRCGSIEQLERRIGVEVDVSDTLRALCLQSEALYDHSEAIEGRPRLEAALMEASASLRELAGRLRVVLREPDPYDGPRPVEVGVKEDPVPPSCP